jgi:phosphomethylpyrimidine synthase
MTQIELAKKNKITPIVREIAKIESLSPKLVAKLLAQGKIVMPKNANRLIKKPCGIGKNLTTKINANIGTSTDESSVEDELRKLDIAVKFGSDTVMDLSVGGDLMEVLRRVLNRSSVPIGTVPIYQAAVIANEEKGSFLKMTKDDILELIEYQAKLGVDFFTLHAGVTRRSVSALKKSKRLLGIVSRGGVILANWIYKNKKENPIFEYFDDVLDILNKYDITLSLGDGLRPGSIFDATDSAQITELKILADLFKRANAKGVQTMIEGPGHVPINQVVKNIVLEKKICKNAPFYILGPLVTDIAAGYDHINGAIGGCLAASVGADFLCYVTPSEHLRHPDVDDVKEGVIASKIAAHGADIAKGIKSAIDWDRKMSVARRNRDWQEQIKLSLDPDKAREYRSISVPKDNKVCTMCGDYCSIKLMGKLDECFLRD